MPKRASRAASARANVVYDFVVEEAWKELDGRDGLALIDSRGFLVVNVEDRLLVRFKKLNKDLRAHSIPTRQACLFRDQEPLPGMPTATHIVAGYLLDATGVAIERMAFVCWEGSRRLWHLPIPEPGAAVVVEHPSAPPPSTGPIPIHSKRTPKKGGRREESES